MRKSLTIELEHQKREKNWIGEYKINRELISLVFYQQKCSNYTIVLYILANAINCN